MPDLLPFGEPLPATTIPSVSTASTMTDPLLSGGGGGGKGDISYASVPTPTIPTLSAAVASPPLPASSPPEESSTMVSITILVISGQRKTFRFEGATTILRLKEYIYHGWPAEWTTEPARPPSPAYFRILYRGRMLDDDSTLTSNGIIPIANNRSTIVHLSVRTFPLAEGADDSKFDSDSLPRPPLHSRASSRIQRVVAQTVGRNPGTTGNDLLEAETARSRRAPAAAGGAGEHGSGGGEGGCGCVIS